MFGLQIVDGASSVVFSSGLERTLEFRLWVAGQTNAIGWLEKHRKNEKDIERPKNKRMTKKNPLLDFLQIFEQNILNTFLNMILHIHYGWFLYETLQKNTWIHGKLWKIIGSFFFLNSSCVSKVNITHQVKFYLSTYQNQVSTEIIFNHFSYDLEIFHFQPWKKLLPSTISFL